MDAENLTDWIDRYLRHQLQGAELALFEEKLKTDPGLAEEVALQARLVSLLKQTGMRDFLQQVEKSFSKETSKVSRPSLLEFSLHAAEEKIFPPEPQTVYIAFEGDGFFDQPILKVSGRKPQIMVKIYPPTEKYFYHYRISNVLTLYGDFDISSLTFVSELHQGHEYYELRIGDMDYELGHYSVIRPLIEVLNNPQEARNNPHYQLH